MKIAGIGVDLEPVASFRRRALGQGKFQAFYRRIFSDKELNYCRAFRDPAPHLAVRFCAKEALVKAANGSASLLVTDAAIENGRDGAPKLRARSSKLRVRKFFQNHRVLVSLTHSKDLALAFVIVLRKRGEV